MFPVTAFRAPTARGGDGDHSLLPRAVGIWGPELQLWEAATPSRPRTRPGEPQPEPEASCRNWSPVFPVTREQVKVTVATSASTASRSSHQTPAKARPKAAGDSHGEGLGPTCPLLDTSNPRPSLSSWGAKDSRSETRADQPNSRPRTRDPAPSAWQKQRHARSQTLRFLLSRSRCLALDMTARCREREKKNSTGQRPRSPQNQIQTRPRCWD